jgi:small metal-binding protein
MVVLSVGLVILLGVHPVHAGEPQALPQGRVEVILANEYRKDVEVIKRDFEQAGLSNVHFQFLRQGQPPPNLGLGPNVSAERARAAIALALKYNRSVNILLPAHLFPPNFVTIASSNFDDTVEFPINEEALRQLQDPSLTTDQFHDLYRRLTTRPIALQDTQEHVRAMLKDAEEMIAHGGMGDAKAIVHHCHEVVKHAEAILKAVSPADPRAKEASVHLREAIRHCQRVASLGDQVDPGVTLNPATKARAAVREAAKHLASLPDGGTR